MVTELLAAGVKALSESRPSKIDIRELSSLKIITPNHVNRLGLLP
jgi:hypothetical protein